MEPYGFRKRLPGEEFLRSESSLIRNVELALYRFSPIAAISYLLLSCAYRSALKQVRFINDLICFNATAQDATDDRLHLRRWDARSWFLHDQIVPLQSTPGR